MNIASILTSAPISSSSTPRCDLELLLAFALEKSKKFLYANSEYELNKEQELKFKILFERRVSGEPIAYILGKKEFWSIELAVNKNVLIPRPETEMLVEAALNKFGHESITVADVGTGSGAIAIAIATERPKWNITATDISKEALNLARYNAAQLKLNNIEFCIGNWCEAFNKKFDLIISNPPYIAQNNLHLLLGDVRFEPKIALEAGVDGLTELQKIIVQAKDRLKLGGLLMLEYGYDQNEKVRDLLSKNKYRNIMLYRDLSGIYRIVTAEK